MFHSLPPQDLPPKTTTEADTQLHRQLERAVGQHFFRACGGTLQAVLMECHWKLKFAEVLTLAIKCPDKRSNWRVLNHLAAIADKLAQFSQRAKISVHPPAGEGTPFEMRVDERSIHRDS